MTLGLPVGTVSDISYREAAMSNLRRGRSVWLRSGRCAASDCVEVMHDGDGRVLLRSSQRPEKVLRFSVDEWSAFLDGLTQGDFD